MATDLIEIDPENPAPEAIDRAAQIIRRGGIVAVPTEALYTILADPLNLQAVTRVFKAKGREPDRSLPLLVGGLFMAEDLVKEITLRFNVLVRHFWPGPLTLIVPASEKVPLKVTGNTGRLALRQSRAPVVKALLDKVDQPLIGTSANISGQPQARSGIDIFAHMDGRLDLVLDGGICGGEGSTTVDITEPYWRMIKEGAISEREIADCLKAAQGHV